MILNACTTAGASADTSRTCGLTKERSATSDYIKIIEPVAIVKVYITYNILAVLA